MSSTQKVFDAIVIGAGSGGLNIAVFLNSIGLKVVLIDKSDKNIGGDCLNFGCVPSKALIHVARLVKQGKDGAQFGVTQDGVVDMRSVKQYIHNAQEHIRTHENAAYFRAQGIEVVLGSAHFKSRKSVEVDGIEYVGKKIYLATGSRPRTLTLPGIEHAPVYTNETIFDLETLPKQLVVIGAGPIGIELGQAFRHLGSEVTIVDRGDKILPREDADIRNVLFETLQQDGLQFQFEANTKEIRNSNTLIIERDGTEVAVQFDALLVAIGRELNKDNLDLEKAGISLTGDGRKIKVNEYLETTNSRVSVIGDIAGMHQFTHAAEAHASVLLTNAFTFWKKKFDPHVMNWVTYTNPEIATFGWNEKELRDAKKSFELITLDFKDDDRAIVDSNTGLFKVYVDRKGYVYGGSMVAPKAGELVQELLLLVSQRRPLGDLLKKVYPYPTATRINRRLAQTFAKKKLTTGVKKILRILFH